MSHDPEIDDLMEQIECSTITRDNMEGRLNGWLVKYAAMKAERDELLSQLKQVEALSEIRLAQRDELLADLLGMCGAIRNALPYLPADHEAIYCGEWLDAAKETIARVRGGKCETCNGRRHMAPSGAAE